MINNLYVINIPGMELCSVNFCIPIGQADDPENYPGLNHLIEHLLFQSHPKLTQEKFLSALEELGGFFNAFTDKDTICVFGRIHKKHVNDAIQLIFEAIIGFKPTQNAVDQEKKVIQAEFHPSRVSYTTEVVWKLHELLYKGHPYARNHSDLSGVPNISVDTVVEHYFKYFSIENWALVVIGDINPYELSFFKWERKLPIKSYQRPTDFGTGTHEIFLKSGSGVGVGIPITYEHFPLLIGQVIVNMLTGVSSPIYSKLVKEYGHTYSVYGHTSHMLMAHNLEFIWKCSQTNVQSSLDLFQSCVDGILSGELLNARDIQRGVEKTISELYLQQENYGRLSRMIVSELVFLESYTPINDRIQYLRSLSTLEWLDIIKQILNQKIIFVKSS